MATKRVKQPKLAVGRPRKYQTPEQFDLAVQAYFDHCSNPDNNEPITWTGLCLFMGFYGRQELDNYLEYDGFSDSVKRAKTLVEFAYEKRLVTSDKPTGPIFALKNFGWKDKAEEAPNDALMAALGMLVEKLPS